MNVYSELNERHQQEFNEFPMVFAFSKEQLDKAMVKLGLDPGDTDKVVGFFGGGIYRKSDQGKLDELLERQRREKQQAIDDDKTGKGYIFHMFYAVLDGHEFGFTEELDDSLELLGLTMEEIEKSKPLKRGLKLAIEKIKKRSALK